MSDKKAQYAVFIAQPRDKEFSGYDRAMRYAPAYYETYATDVGCGIGNTLQLPDNQLLSVLQAVAAENNPYVLLFQHGGSSEGLRFDVGDKKHSPPWAKMAALLLLLELRSAWSAAKQSDSRTDWQALARRIPADPPKQLWWGYPREVLAVIANTKRSRPEDLRPPTSSLADLKTEVVNRAERWWDSLLGVLEVSREEARTLVSAIEDVHKLRIEWLELRACSVGADGALVELIGRFFGAKSVRASTKMLFMGRMLPLLDATFAGFEKRRTTSPPPRPSGPMSEAERRNLLNASHSQIGVVLGVLPPPPPMVHPCPAAATAYLVARIGRPLDFSYLYEFRFLAGNEDEVYFGGTFGAEFTLATESRRAMVAFVQQFLETPRYGTGWILTGEPVPFHFIHEANSPPVFSGDPKYQNYLVTVAVPQGG